MRRFIFVAMIVAVLGISTFANAALVNNGGGLIYDTDLNITWYDAPAVLRNWNDSMTWAANLTVTVNGKNITGWRLPTALNQDGTGPNRGYNVTGSEMGHLYYKELGNKGYYDVNGKPDQLGWGLMNKGPFTNLLPHYYWSSTEYTQDTNSAWHFLFESGAQSPLVKAWDSHHGTGLAVHEGNVGGSIPAPVPIPGTLLLLAPGLAGLAVIRRRLMK